MRNNKKYPGVSLIVFILGILTLLAFAGIVVDLGSVIMTQSELQKIVETSALVGASNLEPKKDSISGDIMISSSVADSACKDSFDKMKTNNSFINSANLTKVEIKPESKAVRLTANANATLYFMGVLGIKNVNVIAVAAAVSAPLYADQTDLLNASTVDTNITQPVGGNTNRNSDFNNIYGAPDGKALALGPSGYITLKFPLPIEDLYGPDLYIKLAGNPKGYFVYAGIDINADNPYISADAPGDGIKWVNISCTGTPYTGTSDSSKIGAYNTNVLYNGNEVTEAKFYGSGAFDIGATCRDANGTVIYDGSIVKSATYLKIIDDGVEDGFMYDNSTQPVLLTGDHSSINPGVNIDSVAVLHHTKLIKPEDYDIDFDNDGLIDVVEDMLGTDKNNSDTDGDGIPDGVEYVGWYGVHIPIINTGASQVYFTDPRIPDANHEGVIQAP